MPICYIHIGPHKTGSSSIKHFIRGNVEQLSKLGLFFPMLRNEAGRPARNHEDLAKADEINTSGELEPHARLWLEIDVVARRAEQNILLSSEMFCRSLAQRETLDRIRAYFDARGYRVVILAYVRDQPAWLNSWFVQSQKRFAWPGTFDEFVERRIGQGNAEPSRYLEPYLADDRCPVEIISFERAATAGLEEDFIRRCGIGNASDLIKDPIRNVNAGAKTVFAARQIMDRIDGSPRDHNNYSKGYRKFKLMVTNLRWDEQPYVALDENAASKIRERLRYSNDAFAQQHFGVSWSELCPPRAIVKSTFDLASASPDEIEEIEDVVGKTVRRFARDGSNKARSRVRAEPTSSN